ncbi:hypothetical protein L6E24_11030 [Methanoplanus endosymbiosus]|uniref:Restriction endonuclease n=1 Tax=Methanoplanus endosymbiosus TaxID=33865 RepID=A0A9E7PR72_9EURY|nr:hypothetical protein L6E24_11030 [Methanoplanus endosymbiosus]
MKNEARKADSPQDLVRLKEIYPALLKASMISAKAEKYFDEINSKEAINMLINEYLEPKGDNFADELTYRYLLSEGDSFGGHMRNVIGNMSEWNLKSMLISAFELYEIDYHYYHNNKWNPPDSQSDIYRKAKGFAWSKDDSGRTLMFNINVPFLEGNGKNVDVCLYNCHHKNFSFRGKKDNPPTNSEKELYLCLGELKGGIDPAGSDEHWKTANEAISRIRKAFSDQKKRPAIFFAGAAIVETVAKQMWSQLESGELTNAANITNKDHLSSLCSWIISL